MNTNTSRVVSLIGAGIFICLTIQGTSFFISWVLRDALIFTSLDPKVIYGIKEYASMIIPVLAFFLFIRRLSKIDFQKPNIARNMFLLTMGAFGLTQVIGFFLPFTQALYDGNGFYDKMGQYLFAVNQDSIGRLILIDYPVQILEYFFIGLIVWKGAKSLSTPHMQE